MRMRNEFRRLALHLAGYVAWRDVQLDPCQLEPCQLNPASPRTARCVRCQATASWPHRPIGIKTRHL